MDPYVKARLSLPEFCPFIGHLRVPPIDFVVSVVVTSSANLHSPRCKRHVFS
jgi:hypothetical protein